MNILDQIFECGIVGCGGAGFPTHVKLNTQVEYFIVNAAECEPLLRTDRYTMKHRAGDIIDAVEAIGDHLRAAKKVIALKGHYHEEIACLEEAIAAKNSDVELFFLENFYPAGDEQIMVYEVTGRVIPPAGIPSAVNAVVSNVGTVAAISDAMRGIPLTQKIITVTGEVNVPTIVSAPVGTPIQEVIDAGDPIPRRYTVILGGPLMGRRVGMTSPRNMSPRPVQESSFWMRIHIFPEEGTLPSKPCSGWRNPRASSVPSAQSCAPGTCWDTPSCLIRS